MAGSKQELAPANPRFIDTTHYKDVRYWANELKCTPDQLRNAVKAAGNSVAAVKAYLAAH